MRKDSLRNQCGDLHRQHTTKRIRDRTKNRGTTDKSRLSKKARTRNDFRLGKKFRLRKKSCSVEMPKLRKDTMIV